MPAAHAGGGEAPAAGVDAAMVPGAIADGGPNGAHAGGAAGAMLEPGAAGATGEVQKFDENTAEYVVQQLVLKLQTGEIDGIEELIGEKAREQLGELREGTISPEMLEAAKQMMTGVQLVNVREASTGKTIILRNAAGQTLSFTCRREDGNYKVTALKVDKPRGR